MAGFANWKNGWMRLWSRLWLWPRVGLGAKMTVIVIIGTIALVSLFAYMGIDALNRTIQASLQAHVVVAQTAARHIDYVLATIEHDLAQAADVSGLSDPARRARALELIYPRLNFFGRQLLVVDRNSQVVAAYPAVDSDITVADSASVQAVLAGQPFAISRQAHTIHAGARSVLAVAAIEDASGTIAGALVLSVDLANPHIGTFNSPSGLSGSGYMDLVDVGGVILASTEAERVGQASDHNTTLAKMIQARQSFVSRCHKCHTDVAPDPHPEVVAFAALTRAPWGVTVRQDEDEVLAQARELQWRIFALGALALVGALVLVYLTTHSVITPVQALTAATERIAAGDLDTPMEPGGRDEIGALARSFDSMRSQLRESITEIQAWNRELDTRVQERTAALAAAQRETQESRDYLQTIIDSLSDDLLVIDRNFRVTRVNEIVQRRHGGASVIGSYCHDLEHADGPCHSNHECPVPTVVETGKPVRVVHLHCQRGERRFVQVTASPLRDREGQVSAVVELLRDVTEEKILEETILRRNRELSVVNAIARVVGQSLKLDECLERALNEVQRITQMDVGSIFLVEGEGRVLQLRACYGISPAAAEATGRFALGDTACGGVLEIGEPSVVQNMPRSTRATYGALQREGLASLVHVPLIAKGKPLGTLCLGTREARTFDADQVALLSVIGNQIAVAVENAQLYEELRRREQWRGELLRHVISAQEEERKRIARELHDETSQTLTALLYALDSTPTLPLVEKMRRLTVSAIDGVHKVIFTLRPTMLDQLGLVAALRWYAESRFGDNGMRLEVSELGAAQRLPALVETALFRTVQEAINNVARHAGARHLRIVFNFKAEQVEIRVEDDGIGFDASQVAASPDPRRGLGLMSMQERMNTIGGEFFLTSAPGQGTTILLRVPMAGGNHGSDGKSPWDSSAGG
ncbi:MAG: GAF domain-containing protein [Chloroflexi bacterium]|nr:GAF domain-containing protein [Chloroflexota bacterium]